ncbi:amino acid transporter [Pestalotiopsis sp. NC0098]|nr:amino acid transporter [Pestalotiopsis sp. NC0098]
MKPSMILPLGGLALASATPLSLRNTTLTNGTCTTLNQRKAWHTLEDTEKSDYISAVKCLMTSPPVTGIAGAKNRWDELHYCHIQQSNFIHGVGAFLPWHRLFIHLQEKLLQDECGYTGAVPYWHEQRDLELYGTIDKASIWGSDDLSFGTNGTGPDGCVMDGPFANTTLHIDQVWGVDYYDDYCLARSWNQTAYLTANQSYVDICRAKDNYNDANFCYVDNPHSCGHLATGGTMEDQNASPGDPVFFLHHANLDRLWWLWQKDNLTARLTDMSGSIIPPDSIMQQNRWLYPSAAFIDYDGDAGNDTTLNHVLWMANIIPNVTIAEVMDLNGDMICAEYIEPDE